MQKSESRSARAVVQSLEPRLLLAGDLDRSYGEYGYAIGSDSTTKWDAELTVAGKLLVLTPAPDSLSAQLVRYGIDGRIDTSFGSSGSVVLPKFTRQVELDSAGRIVVGGISPDG